MSRACWSAGVLGCAAVVWSLGCAAARREVLPAVPAEPAALLAVVRIREDRIVSLRARFMADTHAGGEEHRTDGVLLVKKPDRFRMRLMLPFGPTVFDYVRWGEHTQVTLPLQGMGGAVPPSRLAPFAREDFDEAFLRGPYAFPGSCAATGDNGGVDVVCRDAAGMLLRRIAIDPNSGTIRDETSFDAGAPRMVLRYGDYHAVAGVLMPFQVAMIYPQRDLSVEITISKYEVNPPLADDLFAPSRPWGS